MKNTVKVILSGAVVASSLATYGNVAQAATQEGQDVTTQISQKASDINPDHYMDSNYHLRKTIMALVGAAENTDSNYSHNYEYIEDIGDGRGYTAGVIGFTTGTDDMVHLVAHYNKLNPNNPLKPYESALKKLAQEGSDSHEGLDGFEEAWKDANQNDRDNFVKAQNYVLKKDYMDKAVSAAKEDGLSQLGQYIYFDAIVKHGPGEFKKGGYHEKDPAEWSFDELREKAIEESGDKSPKQGADEADFLNHFIDGRFTATQKENEDNNSDDTNVFDRLKVQQQFIKDQNFDLNLPLDFKMNEESFHLDEDAISHYNDQDVDFEHA
ncbi:chitosanase [Staphylococcus ursi]|uniref:chitosanase n=1 Tax=Staphylococcus sp. MI 10-1553 TaxID=1912064 RepID=UPI001397BBD8|nr:chitosanase [Staphylococcus sp. MI 10-1553]QHW36024.1 chitosanase [Staphylococcus sp. MI 10-1553]